MHMAKLVLEQSNAGHCSRRYNKPMREAEIRNKGKTTKASLFAAGQVPALASFVQFQNE